MKTLKETLANHPAFEMSLIVLKNLGLSAFALIMLGAVGCSGLEDDPLADTEPLRRQQSDAEFFTGALCDQGEKMLLFTNADRPEKALAKARISNTATEIVVDIEALESFNLKAASLGMGFKPNFEEPDQNMFSGDHVEHVSREFEDGTTRYRMVIPQKEIKSGNEYFSLEVQLVKGSTTHPGRFITVSVPGIRINDQDRAPTQIFEHWLSACSSGDRPGIDSPI